MAVGKREGRQKGNRFAARTAEPWPMIVLVREAVRCGLQRKAVLWSTPIARDAWAGTGTTLARQQIG
jgi:hypothetical protein